MLTERELLKDKPHVQLPFFLINGYSINFLFSSPTNQIGTLPGCCSAQNNIEMVWLSFKQFVSSSFVENKENDFLPSNIATGLSLYDLKIELYEYPSK